MLLCWRGAGREPLRSMRWMRSQAIYWGSELSSRGEASSPVWRLTLALYTYLHPIVSKCNLGPLSSLCIINGSH